MGAPLQSRTTTSCSGCPGALLRRLPTAASTSATTCWAEGVTKESWSADLASHLGNRWTRQQTWWETQIMYTCYQMAHCVNKDAHRQAASLGVHWHCKAQPPGLHFHSGTLLPGYNHNVTLPYPTLHTHCDSQKKTAHTASAKRTAAAASHARSAGPSRIVSTGRPASSAPTHCTCRSRAAARTSGSSELTSRAGRDSCQSSCQPYTYIIGSTALHLNYKVRSTRWLTRCAHSARSAGGMKTCVLSHAAVCSARAAPSSSACRLLHHINS